MSTFYSTHRVLDGERPDWGEEMDSRAHVGGFVGTGKLANADHSGFCKADPTLAIEVPPVPSIRLVVPDSFRLGCTSRDFAKLHLRVRDGLNVAGQVFPEPKSPALR